MSKLQKVKEALEFYANEEWATHIFSNGSALLPSERHILWKKAKEALAELKAYTERMDSAEFKCNS